MPLSEWPKNDEIVSYRDIADPIREAFLHFAPDVDWEELTRKRSFKWRGLPFGKKERATCLGPKEKLTRKELDKYLERGQDVLDHLIHIAFCLGMEQGRRLEVQDKKPLMLALEAYKVLYESRTSEEDHQESTGEKGSKKSREAKKR